MASGLLGISRAFFDPRSVAVIGASRDPSKVGGSVLANLRAAGFAGRIWPVNPRGDVVQGLPATASLLAVDGPVDLAVIAVPAPAVLPALKECVAKGVRGAVVISAGFREAGEEGRAREAELRAWLGNQPIRVLGPNCLGWIRPSRRLNVTFAPGMPQAGGIAFVSHSGALARPSSTGRASAAWASRSSPASATRPTSPRPTSSRRWPPTPRRASSPATSRASPTAGASSRRCAPRPPGSRWCC